MSAAALIRLTRRPDCFSAVMAAGIVSVAAQRDGLLLVSRLLLAFALAAYAVLTLLRISGVRDDVREDPVGMLTFVAGSAVLGARLASGSRWIALALLALGLAVWVPLLPAVCRTLVRSPARAASGRWLLAVVAPASLAAAAAGLSRILPSHGLEQGAGVLLVLAVVAYPAVLTRLALRLARPPRIAWRLGPDWWIVAGAAAVLSVAAAALAGAGGGAAARACAVGAWAVATLAACALALAELLKLAGGRGAGPLEERYATVFPLGMLATASFGAAGLLGSSPIRDLGHVVLLVALAAWLLVTLGLLAWR